MRETSSHSNTNISSGGSDTQTATSQEHWILHALSNESKQPSETNFSVEILQLLTEATELSMLKIVRIRTFFTKC
jgi:hypothetical protein